MTVIDQLGYTAPNGLRRVTNKQLRFWAQQNGSPLYIYSIANGLGAQPGISADIATPENAQFYGGGDMVEGDTLATRIQEILGMTDLNWSLALSAMVEIDP